MPIMVQTQNYANDAQVYNYSAPHNFEYNLKITLVIKSYYIGCCPEEVRHSNVTDLVSFTNHRL